MKVRLSKNSFVRIFHKGEIGYITSQLTLHDRTYDGIGADFLSMISREPQEEEDIIKELATRYISCPTNVLREDFTKMMEDLSQSCFVVRGETDEELNERDITFSYSLGNPKYLIKSPEPGLYDESILDTQELFLKYDSKTPRLASLQFELTGKCNERCIHCYIPNGKKDIGITMPLNKVKDILDQFVEMGGLTVTLSGGEALLHRDIIEILKYCRKKDLKITILSNLALLRDDLIPVLKETNVSLVQVSIYSMDPEIHDFITTIKGSFEKTKAAIEKLHKADIPLQISCPVMKANRVGYDKVLEYAHTLSIKASTDFIMMARADLDKDNLANRLSIPETELLLKDIIENDEDYAKIFTKIRPLTSINREEYLKTPLCGAGFNDICVAANGDIYPCAGWQAMVVGNVYKESLKDIWEKSEKLQKIRNVTFGDFPQCVDCEARNYCAVCMVRNYNENEGDMFKVSKHFCDVAFLNKKIAEEKFKVKL
ncbi:MAG: radical SAM protein [Muribaculaceae bacterium]|nr:radical SAM protein [Muribaculaceae bacterium]